MIITFSVDLEVQRTGNLMTELELKTLLFSAMNEDSDIRRVTSTIMAR
jgi:hypothetical protein